MWKFKVLAIIAILALVVLLILDRKYVPDLQADLTRLDAQKMVVANKLATAKILQENLRHVRELVFQNMEVKGFVDSVTIETQLFRFLTESVQDLKLKLISVKPLTPFTTGRVTTYPYEVEVEGDFFKFGELCSKFENSRRIINLKDFQVDLTQSNEMTDEYPPNRNQAVKIQMTLETFWVK